MIFVEYPYQARTHQSTKIKYLHLSINTKLITFYGLEILYKLKIEPENRLLIESPEDYLLAYWIGRYYGFISEVM